MDIKKCFHEIIDEIEPGQTRLNDTPARTELAYEEFFDGYNKDLSKIVHAFYDSDMDDIIILKNVPFQSYCEHHIVPIIGYASVGYIPNKKKIIGASKIARIVDCFAHRLQLQERLTIEIAKALDSILGCAGVGVYIEGEHFCISKRGVKKDGAKFVTRYFTKEFKTNYNIRREFLDSVTK